MITGIDQILHLSGVGAPQIAEVLHGTTVGSNTLLQKTGARCGLITTKGFRDILEIGRLRTPSMFDLGWDKPEPLIQRRNRLEADERTAADGSGLANVMPRLMRAMLDMPTAFARRTFLPYLISGDTILSRRPFIPSVKAIVAESLGDSEWRLVPPMFEIDAIERRRMVDDFLAWDRSLPVDWQSFAQPERPSAKIIGLRRA